jgi:uncharacterized protein (DUF697 family)/uncharacterized tellurite resistance protein B-like protein
MPITREESIASLRLLVCMAKADGVLHDEERPLLEEAFGELELPAGVTLQWLLDEPADVYALLAELPSIEAREHAYAAVYALACADGDCSAPERALLVHIREALGIEVTRDVELAQAFAPRHQLVAPSGTPILDTMARDAESRAATRKCAIVSALLGAFPFPGLSIATDLMIVGLQVGLARDIGQLWGHQLDYAQAKGILAGFGVGTGARIAVSNLLKVFPGWGSAFGAASAYASSHAVGRVMNGYFEAGRGLDTAELTRRFKQAKAEGKQAYADDAETIEQRKRERGAELAALERRLEAAEIDAAHFEREARRLAE